MFEPAKHAFGHWMARYFQGLVDTTQPLKEYVTRPVEKAIAWAPGRMIDAAEDMLAAFIRADQRHESNQRPYQPPKLPAIICALARDHTPAGHDFTRPISDPLDICITGDPLSRHFKIRTHTAALRFQVVFFAHDEPSCRSLAAQFIMFCQSNRRYQAVYEFGPFGLEFPCQLESTDLSASSIPSEAKNLTILTVDLTIHCTAPLVQGPKLPPHDNTEPPFGYPVVQVINIDSGVHKRDPLATYTIGQYP